MEDTNQTAKETEMAGVQMTFGTAETQSVMGTDNSGRKEQDQSTTLSEIERGESGATHDWQKLLESLRKRFRLVIFPNNKAVQIWDALMLALLWFLAFLLPFQIGVSGGYYLLVSTSWLVINILMNTCFVVDTFLYFFRAFYDSNGLLVTNPSVIAKRYARGLFIPNLISCAPTTILFVAIAKSSNDVDLDSKKAVLVLIKFFDLLKFVRFVRVQQILSSSDLVTHIRHTWPSQVLALSWFLFLLVLVSHWFACIWCFVAVIEAGGFGENLLHKPNWISMWYNSTSGTELYPFGGDKSLDRYVLSLFWSIQTLTSIGYGNIAPYTVKEWWVSCLLMLLAGLMWAYVIGSTVSIASSLQQQSAEYDSRIDQVNSMVRIFPDPITGKIGGPTKRKNRFRRERTAKNDGVEKSSTSNSASNMKRNGRYKGEEENPMVLAQRIRKFLHTKYLRGHGNPNKAIASSLLDTFEVLEALPQGLREASMFQLCKDAINDVSYLSDESLPMHLQKFVATQIALMDYGAGERLSIRPSDPTSLVGIHYVRLGSVISSVHFNEVVDDTNLNGATSKRPNITVLSCGQTVGTALTLVEPHNPLLPRKIELGFLTYSEVLFIPREAIMTVFQLHPDAWRYSAKYEYFKALLMMKLRCKAWVP